jgi:hypothetical protein
MPALHRKSARHAGEACPGIQAVFLDSGLKTAGMTDIAFYCSL